LQVEGDRPLVAVSVLLVRAAAGAARPAALARRGVDAHDVGAPVGELADTGGPGSRDGEVDDPDVVERQRHRSGPRRPQAWGMPLPATSCPPSVVMTSPTVYAPAREERKMQRPAMSSGVPTR